MVVCLTSARFNMRADILRPTDNDSNTPENPGHYINQQDPDSGEIIRVWQPGNTGEDLDGDGELDPVSDLQSFDCLARGIVDGGIRVAGTTERLGELYSGVDYVRIWFPARIKLSRRDRITNIRDKRGHIIWIEEERNDSAPTIFNVNGVTPVIDPFGMHIENMALLERVETQ